MTDETTPWWQRQLPALTAMLRGFVRRRVPTLASMHDDLVAETLADFTERLARDAPSFPAAWFGRADAASEADHAWLKRLATTILRRRIADLFRRRARSWQPPSHGDGLHDPADPTPSVERTQGVTQMLAVCVRVLAEASLEDRALLASASGLEGEPPPTLDPRSRQRLYRLRQRLREAIRSELGDDALTLLNEGDT